GQQGFGVARGERAEWFDEAVPLIRKLWRGEPVDHHGPRFQYEGVRVEPRPIQDPPDVWLGGKAPSELRRVGRLGDGWLASFTTPEQCKAARVTIEDEADAAGRTIDPEHFGAMVLYTHDAIPDGIAQAIRTRNPQAEIEDVVARGWAGLRGLCERYVAVGFSK